MRWNAIIVTLNDRHVSRSLSIAPNSYPAGEIIGKIGFTPDISMFDWLISKMYNAPRKRCFMRARVGDCYQWEGRSPPTVERCLGVLMVPRTLMIGRYPNNLTEQEEETWP
jgi:hypothetical protein